ncbi:RHS repeat-associated core domain-containing protein [Rapidithrix thailandica]|uniref:RHS repeat-associated core domain-containing protein n=1 Tax=Rapidithrix thailandica TaxID=413964 RepID=A0AAW9S3U9_9BACT
MPRTISTGRPPFGKQMAGRNYSDENCRYGFNGKENDKDFGNQHLIQDYGFRLYNPEIGKFLSVDPLAPDYPWNSTYAFAENRVIDGIDLEGAERKSTIGKFSVDFGYTHGSDHVPYTQHTENIEYALKVAPELEQQEAYRIAYERWRNSPAYKVYMKKRGYHEYDGQWYPNGSIVPVNIEYEAIELAASFGLGKAVRKGVQWGLTRTGNEMLEYAVRKGVPEKLQKRFVKSIVDPGNAKKSVDEIAFQITSKYIECSDALAKEFKKHGISGEIIQYHTTANGRKISTPIHSDFAQ